MKIRVGFDIVYECPQPTPMILTLSVHYSRISDLQRPDYLLTDPPLPVTAYRDGFGNWCSRLVAPAGPTRFHTDAVIRDPGSGHPRSGRAHCRAARGAGSAGRDPGLSPGQPLLRHRPSDRGRLAAVRHGPIGLEPRPGDLRLHLRPRRLRLRALAPDPD